MIAAEHDSPAGNGLSCSRGKLQAMLHQQHLENRRRVRCPGIRANFSAVPLRPLRLATGYRA